MKSSYKFLASAALGASMMSGLAMANGFEAGIPAGWTCNGVCNTLPADGVVPLSPAGFSRYGFVASRSDSPTGLALPGVGGAGSPSTGSRLRSVAFSANAGDDLEFFFNFVTSDGAGFADYAWARLLDGSLNEVAVLFTARTTPGGNTVPGFSMPPLVATIDPDEVVVTPGAPNWSALGGSSGSCFDTGCGHTGWVRSTYEIPSTGSFVLEFGVVNWNDTQFQSGLAFDGITVAGQAIGGSTPISVPTLSFWSSLLLMLMALMAGLVAVRSRA